RHHRMRAVPRPAPRAQPPAVALPSAPGLMAMPLQPVWLWVLCSATLWVMLWVITGGFGGEVTLWQHGPCFFQVKLFLAHVQNQGELKLCEGFIRVLKQCRLLAQRGPNPVNVSLLV
ncbi:hypothetical protein FD755_020530, partial [Muntiacus reevesi]